MLNCTQNQTCWVKTVILFWRPEKGLGDFELESNFIWLKQRIRGLREFTRIAISDSRISEIKGIKLDEIFGNARLSGSRQRKIKLQMDVSKI